MAGIAEDLMDASATFYKDETITAATKTSSCIRSGAGGQLGAMKIVFRVNDAVSLATTKVITFNVQDATDSAGSGAETIGTYTLTASGTTTRANGVKMWEFVLPRTVREFTRVQVISDDSGIVGSMDVFFAAAIGLASN